MARDEKVYEGRGDALADARLTLSDGRMADDLRLKLPHYRIMAHVGRQNGARGWLRVSQSELAERWACHRNTLHKAFTQLVAWGYLEQKTQHEAGESFCQYKVVMDGREPAPGTPPRRRRRKPSESQAGIADTARADAAGCTSGCAPIPEWGAASDVHTCTSPVCTCATPECAPPEGGVLLRAHRHTPTYADKDTHPRPTAGPRAVEGEGKGTGVAGQDEAGPASGQDAAIPDGRRPWLAALRAEARHPAIVEGLIAPLLATLGVPRARGDGHAPNPAVWLGIWRDAAAAEQPSEAGMRKAVEAIRRERVADLPPVRDLAKILADAEAASLLTLQPGDPRRAAWLAHDRRVPAKAAFAASTERNRWPYAVTAEWPPESAAVEATGLGYVIPAGTPEHAAHLAAWRRQGRDGAIRAQSADVSQRTLTERSRWPLLPAPSVSQRENRRVEPDSPGGAA